MILQKIAASAGLAVGLATASWGIVATAGTAAADATTSAANASLAASRTAKQVSSQDRTFMDQASQINLTEVSLGKYMQAHASTTTAKDLGATYAHDHAVAQVDLRTLASHLHVGLPSTPGAHSESLEDRLEAQKGKSLDDAFAKASVSGHQAAIAVYKKEETAGSNAAVKAYATHYLPMLQAHLSLAKHAESVMHVTATK